jgi:hypothetical protein
MRVISRTTERKEEDVHYLSLPSMGFSGKGKFTGIALDHAQQGFPEKSPIFSNRLPDESY